MKIEKITAHHILFDNGDSIKIAPQTMSIDAGLLNLIPDIKTVEFKEPLAFTADGPDCSFAFGNIGGRMIPVSIFGVGVSRECAVYYENKLKLVVEIC